MSPLGHRSTRWRLVGALALLPALVLPAKDAAIWLDGHLLNERLKDGWGRWVVGEDWSGVRPLPPGLNEDWLRSARRPLLVAHALGESGTTGQNSLGALDRALTAGLKLLEIDVWLDSAGQLRCHHGPNAPAAFKAGDCTLRGALHAAAARQAWLVLDIKTEFAATGEAIVKQCAGDPAASHLVFQLYRPQDFAHFARWSAQLPLPRPMLTAYLSRRSVPTLAARARELGIHVLAIPLYRAAALGSVVVPGVTVVAHPVHDCRDLDTARAAGTAGYYIRTDLLTEGEAGCGGRV